MGTHPIFESDFDCLTVYRVIMDNLIGISGLTRCYPFELQFRHCKKEYGDYAQYYPKYHLNKRYYNNNDNYCDFYLHVNTLCEEGNFEKIEKLKNQFLEK